MALDRTARPAAAAPAPAVAAPPPFLGPAWADSVRAAVDSGPPPEVRAAKLDKYWAWIERRRADYTATWVLGVRGAPAALGGTRRDLTLEWAAGRCVRAAVTAPGAPTPPGTYVLSADYPVWCRLLVGDDPGRVLMYRQMRLEHGDVLLFFRGVYFFVESLAALARVPAALP
ncbi:hypothetical protein ACFPZ0_26805 [Streptomonospora nanhaiensis]|uniref:SCP2 domain-containing protein n=1 Tax=Streptomonospora nanhaiensis TaxID=1323731 RepID=A0A853BQF8_9ACTN|nr:hypothetical protein [Streptomonospora nanhaiensis]MBV2366351.1 hypothetical protein [Streptomonospora nanhaiensis]MBX9391741.1 hypothetical protein [Streptomonospora nanhaiensis]NYI97413.1 hypothetical protein [Streptomonospora nanhaiensis]